MKVRDIRVNMTALSNTGGYLVKKKRTEDKPSGLDHMYNVSAEKVSM